MNASGGVLYKEGVGPGHCIDARRVRLHGVQGRTSVQCTDGDVKTRHKWLFFRGDPKPGPGSDRRCQLPNQDLIHRTDYVALTEVIPPILASAVALTVVATRL